MKKIHTFVVLAYKESSYLEECIKSVLNQKYKSDIVIGTSTPNKYIDDIAKKYNLSVVVNKGEKGIGADFDFAITCAKTKLVTIAHQDDIYDYEYSDRVVEKYYKNNDASIIFTNYYEIKGNKKVYDNTNLKIKRVLLLPLKLGGKTKFSKRFCLRFGNAISCPAVTFNKEKIRLPLFNYPLKSNVDWQAWEKLSKKKEKFIYISKPLMGHRVHEESTTTEIIHDNIRTEEDLEMLKKFWPIGIAKVINRFYKNAEKSNEEK